MYFHKYPHPANFEFPSQITPCRAFETRKGAFCLEATASDADIYHLRVSGKGWETNDSQAGLSLPEPKSELAGKSTRLVFAADGSLSLQTHEGTVLLAAEKGRLFGQCGEGSMFEFTRESGDQFYGMGEKWSGFEHSGKTAKFWNTDIWADFAPAAYLQGEPAPDPTYVAVPYLILKRGNTYVGLLLDNPYATTISTGSKTSIAGQMEIAESHGAIRLSAERGQPNLYLLVGPSLPELTRKLQQLVGVTPLPPAWALGYHQCRWGYESAADLEALDAQFIKHGIPVDGLWLDIDYMDSYKVFTLAQNHFPEPATAFDKLNKAGRKVVPIFDPGVKQEPGYSVYERGRKADAFCQNPQGQEFVGLVWPGETVFPDFSLETARAWWSKEVADFVSLGIYGAWLDMNDPATGAVDNLDMLFDHGTKPHNAFHNQFALGMAQATRQGFLDAHPQERPFLLSRSGFTGSSRYTAIWTGDNASNYHHLKNSIPITLNLALSGIPFNGPDAGGFGCDTTPELVMDWFKAGFLFPFFRNHSGLDTRPQEPWMLGKQALLIMRRFIQLRYRLRPYLYQLFAEQERTGEAILRPLFYDFEDTQALPLGHVDDQFMVGPWIMQAPFVRERQESRRVVLPGKGRWFAPMEDRWIEGGREIAVAVNRETTPLYVRDGAILPMARLEPHDHAFRAERTDFHIFLSGDGETSTRYVFDDGASFAYQRGVRSEVEIHAQRTGDTLAVTVKTLSEGAGKGAFTFSAEPSIKHVTVNGVAAKPVPAQGLALGSVAFTAWES